MSGPITLRVLTDAGLALEEPAVSVIAPGEVGYLGVLVNHAPLVTTLQPGKLIWRRPDGARRTLPIGSGLLEISKNHVTVLTDTTTQPSPPA